VSNEAEKLSEQWRGVKEAQGPMLLLQTEMKGGLLFYLLPLPGEGGFVNQQRGELCGWQLEPSRVSLRSCHCFCSGRSVIHELASSDQSHCWANCPDLLLKELHQVPLQPSYSL